MWVWNLVAQEILDKVFRCVYISKYNRNNNNNNNIFLVLFISVLTNSCSANSGNELIKVGGVLLVVIR